MIKYLIPLALLTATGCSFNKDVPPKVVEVPEKNLTRNSVMNSLMPFLKKTINPSKH